MCCWMLLHITSSYPLVLSVDNLTSTCIQNVVHVECGLPVCYGFYCRLIVMTCTCSVFIDSVVYGFLKKCILFLNLVVLLINDVHKEHFTVSSKRPLVSSLNSEFLIDL